MSGEIGDTSTRIDNSFHVLFGLGLATNTVVDGFIIAHGYADELTPTNGANWRGAGVLLGTDIAHPMVAPSFRNCQFIENHALGFCCAIYCLSVIDRIAAPDFVNCGFVRNDAFNAAAIYKSGPVLSTHPMSFVACHFNANEAVENASVFFEDVSDEFIFHHCFFEENSALIGSAGIFLIGTDSIVKLDIENCQFAENRAGLGSAISIGTRPGNAGVLTKVVLSINNSQFTDNEALNGDAGGIMVNNDRDSLSVYIENSRFVGNESTSRGGALTIFNDIVSHTDLKINRCRFEENIGGLAGGGAIMLSTNFGVGASFFNTQISNTLFVNNRGAFAMGPGQDGQVSLEMRHCTTYGNGAFVLAKTWIPTVDSNNIRAQAYLENNIFWEEEAPLNRLFYNGDPEIDHIRLYRLKHNFVYAPSCDVEGCDEADLGGNLFSIMDNAPLFVDVAEGDFQLRACSPAINAGYTIGSLEAEIEEDFLGNQRLLEDHVDIGAFERASFLLTDFVTISDATDPETNDGIITIDSIQGGTAPFSFLWEDGSTLAVRDDLAPGTYQLTVTDSEDCSMVFEYVVDVMVSTSNLREDLLNIELFPNPVKAGYAVEITPNEPLQNIGVYSSIGEVLWVGKPAAFSQASSVLPSGIYLIKITNSKGKYCWKRMIVQ